MIIPYTEDMPVLFQAQIKSTPVLRTPVQAKVTKSRSTIDTHQGFIFRNSNGKVANSKEFLKPSVGLSRQAENVYLSKQKQSSTRNIIRARSSI